MPLITRTAKVKVTDWCAGCHEPAVRSALQAAKTRSMKAVMRSWKPCTAPRGMRLQQEAAHHRDKVSATMGTW